MRFWLLLFIFLSFSGKASEEQFWSELASLEENIFKSKKEVSTQLNVVTGLYDNSSKTDLMFNALFEVTSHFLEYHGNKIELKDYIEANVNQISSTYIYKNVYLSQLAILYFDFDDIENHQKILERLKYENDQVSVSLVELKVSPSEEHYEKLYSYCLDRCNFYLYHKSIAEYYIRMGHYDLLEGFATKMIDHNYTIAKGDMDIRSILFLAYLFVAKKCQASDIRLMENVNKFLANDIKHLNGLSNSVDNVLKTECL